MEKFLPLLKIFFLENVAKDISLKKVNSSRMKGGMSSEGIFVKSLLVIKESFLMQIDLHTF